MLPFILPFLIDASLQFLISNEVCVQVLIYLHCQWIVVTKENVSH